MAIAFDRVQKPLRQLRKSLRNLPADSEPERVHRLRIRARQIEAVAAALTPASEKLTRRLLKSIKPLRKAAGRVRDMDVLAAKVVTLRQNPQPEPQDDTFARLVDHLQQSRKKNAAALLTALVQQKKAVRHNLKLYAKQLEDARSSVPFARDIEQRSETAAAQLAAELRRWPALSARNLHNFRLKVKELRSVLQLFSGADRALADSPLADALGTVKDQIGDWHDWQQLAKAAAEALKAQQDRVLLSAIREVVKQKLREALAAANALREGPLQAVAKKPPTPERKLPARAVRANPNWAA